jgi:metal-responsive CopG/Arc/MetJ family transcriptional regulator
MSTAKVAVKIERELPDRLDRLARSRRFPSRRRAVQEAVSEKLARREWGRLAQECAELDRKVEQAMADEGLNEIVGSQARPALTRGHRGRN